MIKHYLESHELESVRVYFKRALETGYAYTRSPYITLSSMNYFCVAYDCAVMDANNPEDTSEADVQATAKVREWIQENCEAWAREVAASLGREWEDTDAGNPLMTYYGWMIDHSMQGWPEFAANFFNNLYNQLCEV